MRLLIEIGVEELPAIPFLKEYKNKGSWKGVGCSTWEGRYPEKILPIRTPEYLQHDYSI